MSDLPKNIEAFAAQPDPNGHQNFGNVRLTLKGLTILGCAPPALQDPEQTETLVALAKRRPASVAGIAASEAMKQVVSAVFKLALSSDPAIGEEFMFEPKTALRP